MPWTSVLFLLLEIDSTHTTINRVGGSRRSCFKCSLEIVSSENVPGQRNPQSSVAFIRENTGGLTVPSDEGLWSRLLKIAQQQDWGSLRHHQLSLILWTDISEPEHWVILKMESITLNWLLNTGASYLVFLWNTGLFSTSKYKRCTRKASNQILLSASRLWMGWLPFDTHLINHAKNPNSAVGERHFGSYAHYYSDSTRAIIVSTLNGDKWGFRSMDHSRQNNWCHPC
jgi:hypothetical protein